MDVKFEWKEIHRCAFVKLKGAIIQAPILRYRDTTKPYIMYTDASDDACRAQLSQMHEEAEFPVAFLGGDDSQNLRCGVAAIFFLTSFNGWWVVTWAPLDPLPVNTTPLDDCTLSLLYRSVNFCKLPVDITFVS